MTRHPFKGSIPSAYFNPMQKVYANDVLPYQKKKMEELCQLRGVGDQIIFYFNEKAALTGIFPPGNKALFGYWDAELDLVASAELFHALEEDAKQLGYEKIQGPVNFNTFHSNRIRLKAGESWTSFPGEPANPDYYQDLLIASGFQLVQRYASHFIDARTVQVVYARQQLYLDTLSEIPFEAIPLNATFWKEHLIEIHQLLHKVFSENLAYSPISFDEFKMEFGEDFGARLCPHTSVIFRDKESGEWAAISLCLPNYHELELVKDNFQFERDYPHLKRKTFLAKTVGVHPDYRNRRLMHYLAAYGMLKFPAYYEDAIFCLMREGNISNSFTARIKKEEVFYGLFEKEIN
ncbi:MAG: hypothetical protein GC180_12965 [Bacteroidetes bacterium]|nr:hypothetical protein [Bacteroidota bacterium]